MTKIALNAVGAVLFVAGVIFTLQGLGYLEGSQMSDEKFWAIAGPVIAALGVSLIIVALQRGTSRRP